MPLYTVTTPDDFLSAEQKKVIAAELVRIHTAINQVPANFVHSIFLTCPRGLGPDPASGYAATIGGVVANNAGFVGDQGHKRPRSMQGPRTHTFPPTELVKWASCTRPGDPANRLSSSSRN